MSQAPDEESGAEFGICVSESEAADSLPISLNQTSFFALDQALIYT